MLVTAWLHNIVWRRIPRRVNEGVRLLSSDRGDERGKGGERRELHCRYEQGEDEEDVVMVVVVERTASNRGLVVYPLPEFQRGFNVHGLCGKIPWFPCATNSEPSTRYRRSGSRVVACPSTIVAWAFQQHQAEKGVRIPGICLSIPPGATTNRATTKDDIGRLKICSARALAVLGVRSIMKKCETASLTSRPAALNIDTQGSRIELIMKR